MNITESDKNKVLKLYYNTETGYHKNINKYYDLLNEKILKEKIKFIINNIETNQILNNKKIEKNFIPISNIPGSYQIDLTFYDQFKKQNNNFNGLFTAININTRFGYAKPIKSKSKNEMMNIIKNFIDEIKNIKIIESDAGNEFINKDVKKILDDKNIKLITFNKNVNKNAMGKIERFNRTIRDKLTNYMESNNTNKYIDVIDDIIKNYNNTVHSSTKQKPSLANEEKIFANENIENRKIKNDIKNEFKNGDFVRILIDKNLFEKGSKNKYSKSIFKINGTVFNKFKLENIEDKSKSILVLPYQIKKIDIKNLNSKKETRLRNTDKKQSEIDQIKKENQIKRKIKKEGID